MPLNPKIKIVECDNCGHLQQTFSNKKRYNKFVNCDWCKNEINKVKDCVGIAVHS